MVVQIFQGVRPAGRIVAAYGHTTLAAMLYATFIWRGTQQLRFEAYDYCHFDKETPVPCKRCLHYECKLSFTQRGEWGLHAVQSRHDVFEKRFLLRTENFRTICCVSAEMESALTEKIAELRRLNDEFEQEFDELRKAYLQGQKGKGDDFVDAIIA
jgi:hypothetical protein